MAVLVLVMVMVMVFVGWLCVGLHIVQVQINLGQAARNARTLPELVLNPAPPARLPRHSVAQSRGQRGMCHVTSLLSFQVPFELASGHVGVTTLKTSGRDRHNHTYGKST